jgi:hypothetical protein
LSRTTLHRQTPGDGTVSIAFVAQVSSLEDDAERDVHARIGGIAKVVDASNLNHKNVLRVEPVAWPLVNEAEGITTVLEAAISAVFGLTDLKLVFLSKMGAVTIFWNASTSMVAAALRALFRLGLLGMLWLLPFVGLLPFVRLFRLAVLVSLLGGFFFAPGSVLLFLGSFLFRFGWFVRGRFFSSC